MNLKVNLVACYFPLHSQDADVGFLDWRISSYSVKKRKNHVVIVQSYSKKDSRIRKLTKNLRYPRRPKLPPEPYFIGLDTRTSPSEKEFTDFDAEDDIQMNEEGKGAENHVKIDGNDGEIQWEKDELEAISSLFQGRIYQKPGNLNRERPLPLPVPHKSSKPIGLPTKKLFSRKSISFDGQQPLSNMMYKNPTFLAALARDIKALPQDMDDVSIVLNKCRRFLHKGSLSMTIRELGHMGLPERALQVFCWVQKQSNLFPDDRVLASTVEVLARSNKLKMLFGLNDNKFINLASRTVYEAMVRGFIKGGNLRMAWNLVTAAKDSKRVLDAGIYAKLILELGKNPDKEMLILSLLEELAKREDLNLTPQDCTAIMKICVRFRKFAIVEGLYDWFKSSGRALSVVMYTTLVHSRYTEKKYREAMAVVWEMEAANCLLDLPAYRVLIKLFVAMNDLARAVRYFAKLKEAGFSATFDLYYAMVQIYSASGRIAKCKEIQKEAEMAGIHLPK